MSGRSREEKLPKEEATETEDPGQEAPQSSALHQRSRGPPTWTFPWERAVVWGH